MEKILFRSVEGGDKEQNVSAACFIFSTNFKQRPILSLSHIRHTLGMGDLCVL